MKKYYFTSESVTEGHPDKLCDYISDSILDEYLKQDENSRVAVETFAAKNTITIAGQVTSKGEVDIEKVAREKIKEIGFSAHNDFLEVVYDFGIIAFILYICLHLNLIIYISRLFKYRSEYTASFAVSYVLFLTSSLVAHTYIYIYYMSIFCLFWAFVYASNKLTYK